MNLLRRVVYASLAAGLFLTVSHAVNSHYLYLKIYRHEPERLADRPLGYVPVDPGKPLRDGRSGLLYVRVLGDLPRFTIERLIEVLARRKLAGLDLSAQSSFSDSACAALARLPSLHYLRLDGTAVTDAGLSSLGEAHQLRALGLAKGDSDAGLDTVSRFGELEVLNLADASISDAGLARLAGLPLRRLELGSSITDAGLQALTPLHKLRHLDLGRTRVTDAGVATLTAFPHLETLLAGRLFTSRGLMELAELPALQRSIRRLDLSGTRVDDRAFGALALFKNLEELALSGTAAGDSAVRRLARVPSLRALELSDTLMTITGLEELQALPHLEVLSISLSDHLSVADLRALRRLHQLRLLIVDGRAIGGPQLRRLMAKLEALERSLRGASGAREDTADFIARLGPALPAHGLSRLDDFAEDPGALPADATGIDHVISAPGAAFKAGGVRT